jgi:hypothetical protein
MKNNNLKYKNSWAFCPNLNNKKAEKLFSIWEFFVLALVGLGIVAGVLIYYSADMDTREIESKVLYNSLSNCLISQGRLIDDFFKTDFDIFAKCGLNSEIINSGDFYFNISIFDQGNNKIVKEIHQGSSIFQKDCQISNVLDARNFPKCTKKEELVVYYFDNEKRIALVKILTASNQRGKK